jgi:hypothetical protein
MAEVMVDIDDVLMPTIDSIHELARQAGLHDGTVEPSWAGWDAYGCDEAVYWALWTQFAEEGGYVATQPIPGSVEALRRLLWAGHRIHLVTARGFMAHAEEIRAWTPQWVEEFAIPHHSLTFAQDKVAAMRSLVAPRSDQAYGAFDYAIDDSPRNIRALLEVGVDAYLLNHPHNRDVTDLPRIHSVDAFVDHVIQENL